MSVNKVERIVAKVKTYHWVSESILQIISDQNQGNLNQMIMIKNNNH